MLKLAERFQAFEDRPWNMWQMYRHLDEYFHDSRFILTVRDPESWWRSAEQWLKTNPTKLELYQLHLMVPRLDKQEMIESYLRYNAEVEDYFKGTEKLLVMDIEAGDGWTALCDFLNVRAPAVPFPHRNRQAYQPDEARDTKLQQRLKNGRECQKCGHITIPKKINRTVHKGRTSTLPARVTSRLRKIVRRITKPRLDDIQNLPLLRSLCYKIHRLKVNATQSFLRSFSSSMQISGDPLPEEEFAVVSCFFNPSNSERRRRNFRAFLTHMEQSGVRCLVVELAFGSEPFHFGSHDTVIKVRSDDVLWHKERLLNLGIRQLLSEGVRKIAWLDGDITFNNTAWASEICRRLDSANLCQVFDAVYIQSHETGRPMVAPSAVEYYQDFDQLFSQSPMRFKNILRGILKGGQSGFGWAAKAEVLEQVQLFEHAVVGGGDKLILAASLADDVCDERLVELTHSRYRCKACGYRNRSEAFSASLMDWARQWSAAVDQSVDYARVQIKDMYHGQRSDRGYSDRHDILHSHQFDPGSDLVDSPTGCLQWAPGKKQLRVEVESYFLSRREDT